jgi:voltage-gated potassium channel Kch
MKRDRTAVSFRRRILRWFRWRGIALAAVFLCGFLAFRAGVSVTDRPDVATADAMTHVYYTLGLFVLGGMDLGTPVGGTVLTRGMLWAAYFLAPLLTASAVVEGVVRAINPEAWRLRRLRGHVVVAGATPLSMLYLERLRTTCPKVKVVLVDKRGDDPVIEEAKHRFGVSFVAGDIRTDATMQRVNVDAASRVLLFTDDDFANLDAASRFVARKPDHAPYVAVHVADHALLRVLETSGILDRCHVFNSHEFAATNLVQRRLLAHFEDTAEKDQLVLAGFGRFGQTVLAQLARGAPGDIERVVIIDLHAEQEVRLFDEHMRVDRQHYEREVVEGDMRDPNVWKEVYKHLELERAQPVVVLGSDDDDVNLQVALWLRDRFESDGKHHVKVVVRCHRESAFAVSLAEQCDFELEAVSELIRRGFHPTWFPNRSTGEQK